MTFGSILVKSFYFERYNGSTDKVDRDSLIEFPQNSGSMILLNGRDEELDAEGWCWTHMLTPTHGEDGVVRILHNILCCPGHHEGQQIHMHEGRFGYASLKKSLLSSRKTNPFLIPLTTKPKGKAFLLLISKRVYS
jgi:hypothetical protein